MKHLQEIRHFSHPHVLIPLTLDEGEKINCNGCDKLIHEPFHGCLSCNHVLHDSCINAPRFLQHSSHPDHYLTLLPTPTYRSQSFICNACRCAGKSFSFSCAQCEFDLHIQCASLPDSALMNDKHPSAAAKTTGGSAKVVAKSGGGQEEQKINANQENQIQESSKKAADFQKSVFEAQREMMETHIANKAMIAALINASSYARGS